MVADLPDLTRRPLAFDRFLQRLIQRRRKQPEPLSTSVFSMRDQRLLGDLLSQEQLFHLFDGEWSPHSSVSNAAPRAMIQTLFLVWTLRRSTVPIG